MKSLELNLNKRLLIVEFEDDLTSKKYWYDGEMHLKIELICKGSYLTEDIAYEMVDGFDLGYFVDYNHPNPRGYKLTAIESFISAIESKGWFWKNPLGISTEEIRQNHGDASDMFKEWINYESRTFNPEKCIIFEIL